MNRTNQFDDLTESLISHCLRDGRIDAAEARLIRKAERLGVRVALGLARIHHGHEPRRLLAMLAELDAEEKAGYLPPAA